MLKQQQLLQRENQERANTVGSIRNHMTIKTNKATASGSAILASAASSQKFQNYDAIKPAANKLLKALDRGASHESMSSSNRPSNISYQVGKQSRNSSKINSERGSLEVPLKKSIKMKFKINAQP